MKKSTFILMLAVMCLVIILIPYVFTATKVSAAINPNKNSHVVYYIPHQDDEALTFGVSIMNHLRAGHNVHIVLLTDGAASFVRNKLNMSKADFTAARNREFVLSLKAMGVNPKNVHYMNYEDSKLTVKQVEQTIALFEKKYPKAKHKTFSWTDSGNHDHANAGAALKNLQIKKTVLDARYYVRRGDKPYGLVLINQRYNKLYKPKMTNVSKAYSTNNPSKGLYAIGRTSVKQSFIEFDKQPLSRYHK